MWYIVSRLSLREFCGVAPMPRTMPSVAPWRQMAAALKQQQSDKSESGLAAKKNDSNEKAALMKVQGAKRRGWEGRPIKGGNRPRAR